MPAPDLDALLARLDELEKKATGAPWEYDRKEMLLLPSPSKMHDPDGREGWCGEAAGRNDGELCVALRNAYPALRSEIARLREVERAAREMREHLARRGCSYGCERMRPDCSNEIEDDAERVAYAAERGVRPCTCGFRSSLAAFDRAAGGAP